MFPPFNLFLFSMDLHFIDVTIHEFANSNKVTDRQKKGKTIVGRHLKIAIDTEVGDNHAEASLVDGADDDDDVNDIRKLKSKRKSKRRVANENDDPHHRYAVYPIDVWLLISKHIQPENVCRFALICRQTAAICSSSSFWSHLYKTYYIPVADLPTRLQPECMVRFGGLRSCVIQSLHYMYQPFVDRLREATAQDFHCVEKRECVGSWTYRIKDHWLFCYKLKQKVLANSRLSDAERIRRSKRLLDIHSDIYQNTEEGCKILVVWSQDIFRF